MVASFTDAWIETNGQTISVFCDEVASFTDAWIETGRSVPPELKVESHPLRMRGLKLTKRSLRVVLMSVASFTDAWIETSVVIHLLYVFLVASFTDAWIETENVKSD